MTGEKLHISERALVARLNRALKKDNRTLKKTRSARAFIDLGDWYILDWEIPNIVDHHVDLEDLAREYGVLKEYEALETAAP